ncbi:hypothetical protein Nepgr_002484 [Nepenthes gracilis]|uniref:RRM domain-containing protein n=1 Tax=Nepenthes gracilis TaxID=150966 RepID=A0AAD3P3W3_NEPGR|nr:hypothetical protein Nepgr_002484 [Nepenthes gracilis]
MPPRAKKPTAGPGPKKTARASKVTPKAAAQNPSEVGADEAVKAEEVKADEAVKAAEVKADLVVEANGSIPVKKEDEVKETVDEYEKGEWLDLEDNEPEYEPEEYDGGVDYDEKEFDQEDGQEEGDEGMEEAEEGDVGEEEEGDIAEEGTEDVPEEFEGEEDDERAGEEHEHAELLDAEVEEENREVFKERRKRKEFEVFVGGLDKDATENDLRKVFSAVGEVVEIRLMMNPQTKKNKGFAFLRFATVEQAKRALTELKNPVVNGKQCGVTPSQDSDTLFLGNICKTWTKEALEKKLKHYGIEKIEDLTLVEDSNNPGMNRGFAFLEFSSRSDAMDAFKRLQKRDVVFGVDRPAKVSFADSFIDPGDEIMAQVKTVFVDGLPASWDEDRVREVLKKFGQIEKIELARNMTSARRKDFGFVTFDTHDAAVMCAKSINNADLGEGDAKAKVRVRLSRPLQRGKGKRATHGDHRGGHVVGRAPRAPWNRPLPLPRTFPARTVRGASSHIPPAGRSFKRPIGLRDRRPAIAMPARPRAFPPPPRPHDKRPPVPAYPKSSMTRGYPRREELPPRSRAAADYGPRATVERRPSYRDDYSARAVGYPELHRSTASRPAARRTYADDSYGPRYERPPPSYREGRARDYDSISGSKRPYSAMDDVPPRYTDSSVRNSRARLDYDLAGGASQYGDTYSDRLGRSNVGYSGSRSSISGQDTHGLYSTRSGMGYGGSYGSSDVGGVYSSSYGGDFVSRGSDVGVGTWEVGVQDHTTEVHSQEMTRHWMLYEEDCLKVIIIAPAINIDARRQAKLLSAPLGRKLALTANWM